MSKKTLKTIENITLGKLVHGGQCLSELPNGKKVFVWGGLPEEVVDVQITKKRKSYSEGVATVVHESSPDRIEPEEPDSYLSTSPWQIIDFSAEMEYKDEILKEAFEREGISSVKWDKFQTAGSTTGYRNKMEFGFWGNEYGLNLAHYVRGSKGRQIVDGSILAVDSINQSACDLRDELSRIDIWGGKLKTIVLRASKEGRVVASLFIKEEMDFSKFKLPKTVSGLDIYYSDPKSPASVATKKLYSFGDIKLNDTIMGKNITYDVMSFFQVNIPVFELALKEIKKQLKGTHIVDLYSGVGTIGIVVGANKLVESDVNNIKMAHENVNDRKIDVINASSETAVDAITSETTVILDPPRAGLHKDLIAHINEVHPKQIIYLSCNPSTQARDVKLLEENYNISYAQGFNFFPRTPHIESLVILDLVA
jgi:23S rRNA (uracil1939-C5)-methyltransferase